MENKNDKWIENAFGKAESGMFRSISEVSENAFKEQLPYMMMAFTTSFGFKAAAKVTETLLKDAELRCFIEVVFGSGMIREYERKDIYNLFNNSKEL